LTFVGAWWVGAGGCWRKWTWTPSMTGGVVVGGGLGWLHPVGLSAPPTMPSVAVACCCALAEPIWSPCPHCLAAGMTPSSLTRWGLLFIFLRVCSVSIACCDCRVCHVRATTALAPHALVPAAPPPQTPFLPAMPALHKPARPCPPSFPCPSLVLCSATCGSAPSLLAPPTSAQRWTCEQDRPHAARCLPAACQLACCAMPCAVLCCAVLCCAVLCWLRAVRFVLCGCLAACSKEAVLRRRCLLPCRL